MSRVRMGVFAAAVLFGAGVVVAADGAKTQRLRVEPALQDVAAGGAATVTIYYDATDRTLPGVAMRLHYDSSKLQLDGSRLFVPAMGHQDQPDAGSAYADQFDDGNSETDRRYIGAWSDIGGAWPGEDSELPLALLELRFRVPEGSPGGQLTLTGEGCGQCALELQSTTAIRVVGAGLTEPGQPTAIPAAPTPTTTPTPGLPDLLDPPSDGGIVPYGRVDTVGVPTLSEVGSMLLGALLALSAVAILLRNRG